jgi:hypothetical protein
MVKLRGRLDFGLHLAHHHGGARLVCSLDVGDFIASAVEHGQRRSLK